MSTLLLTDIPDCYFQLWSCVSLFFGMIYLHSFIVFWSRMYMVPAVCLGLIWFCQVGVGVQTLCQHHLSPFFEADFVAVQPFCGFWRQGCLPHLLFNWVYREMQGVILSHWVELISFWASWGASWNRAREMRLVWIWAHRWEKIRYAHYLEFPLYIIQVRLCIKQHFYYI